MEHLIEFLFELFINILGSELFWDILHSIFVAPFEWLFGFKKHQYEDNEEFKQVEVEEVIKRSQEAADENHFKPD